MEEILMDGKTILLFVSVMAVGMFVLPSTLALYTGQHDFVNGSDVDCGKCHGDTSTVGTLGYEVANSSDGAHEGFPCIDCHGSTYAGVNLTGNDSTGYSSGAAHAAGIGINCIGCHSNINYLTAADSTKDGIVNVSQELELSGSAHKYMTLNTANNTGGINDKDLLCVACHTKVDVTIYNLSASTDTNIDIEGGGSDGSWMYSQVD